MSEESLEKRQLKIIVDAVKKVVTCGRAPDWVKNQLEGAVREAKALKPTVSEEAVEIPLGVGCECVDALDPKDKCKYEIIKERLEIEGVQLYDVRVTKGDEKTPTGVVMLNVPSTYLRAVKAPDQKTDVHQEEESR